VLLLLLLLLLLVCCSGDPVLAGRCFELVVCDEATQAPEPASLVALANKVTVR
jgi:superfamily I DNA and/or RNA helicase